MCHFRYGLCFSVSFSLSLSSSIARVIAHFSVCSVLCTSFTVVQVVCTFVSVWKKYSKYIIYSKWCMLREENFDSARVIEYACAFFSTFSFFFVFLSETVLVMVRASLSVKKHKNDDDFYPLVYYNNYVYVCQK